MPSFATILVSPFDVYECFDLAISKGNAGKARMAKGRTVFHAEHEKNFLIDHIVVIALASLCCGKNFVFQFFHTTVIVYNHRKSGSLIGKIIHRLHTLLQSSQAYISPYHAFNAPC